jgi:WD40 repeat protein
MSGVEKIFRVFVSSTFADMVGERTVLQERVFPRLEAYCRERGGRFQAIDLRWGVSARAARDRRTMGICLEEIRRCRQVSPALNFLVLLGDRYGWKPIPAEIDAGDFERLCAASPDDWEELLRAYRRDDNAVPRRYLLVAQREDTESDEVDPAEAVLQTTLSRALAAAFPEGDHRRIAYGGSATHLEIVERLSGDAKDSSPFFCYMRGTTLDPDEAIESATDREMFARLKRDLAARLGARNLRHYDREGEDSGANLDAFARRVEADLRAVVERELRKEAQRPAVDREIDEQQRFARERARNFLGRELLLAGLRDYLANGTAQPLVIVGSSGSGKSSVMARAALDAAANAREAVVVSRFVGATPDTADIELLLRGICAEIGRAYGEVAAPPSGYQALEKEFHRQIAAATPSKPLHIFIDGLDQIDIRDTGALLPWLPRHLPDAARLVVSVLDDPTPAGDRLRTIRGLLPESAFVTLEPLSLADAGRLLDVWLDESGRALQSDQRSRVLDAYAGCPLPLFLRVAFEQARLWRSFDLPPTLESTIERLAQQFYVRLDSTGQHGPILVRQTLRYLCAARYGLAEEEVLALLSAAADVVTELRESAPHSPRVPFVPFVVWSRLRSDLAPYLLERAADETSVLTFYHRALRTAAEELCMTNAAPAAHAHLAGFFAGAYGTPQPHRFARARDATVPNRRKLSELPYQQTQARLWPALTETLADLSFVQTKAAAGMTGDLIADYDRALAGMGTDAAPAIDAAAATLADFRRFVQRERSTFEAHAGIDGLVLQQARNTGNETIAQAWQNTLPGRGWRGRRWFRIDRPQGADDPLVATLERHEKGVTDCVFDASGGLLVSAGMDGAVFAWSTRDWSVVDVIAELDGSADSCSVSADGMRIATACADGYVRIHDRQTRRTIVCDGKYDLSPRRCRFARGDAQVISVGRFGLNVHDAATGRRLQTGLPESTINDCTIGPGTLVTVGDCAETLVVYDTADGSVARHMYLDVRRVQGSAFSPDGGRLLAAGGTFSVEDDVAPFGVSQIWDTKTWNELDGHDHRHAKPALNCAFLDEGRAYVIGLVDGTIEIYDAASGNRMTAFKGHDNGVRGLAVSPDGSCLATASFDGRVKIWRTAALVGGRTPAVAAGRGLFCAMAADGSTGWAFTGNVDRFRCDFAIQRLPFGDPAPPPTPLARSRELVDLTLQRRDPSMPMQASDVTLTAVESGAAHRTSPVPGDGTYWLVHDSARMWPSTFHLLPGIPAERWSRENNTWARSPDGRRGAIVRSGLARVDKQSARHVSLLLFDTRTAKAPARVFERNIDITLTLGQCSYSADGRTVRLAVGPDVWEVDARGKRAPRTLAGDGADVRAFCESPRADALITACADGRLCQWDVTSGALVRSYAAHTGEALDCAFVDTQEFVSIGADATLRLWTLAHDQPLAVFVAETALAALAASQKRRRVLALDVQGRSYFFDVVRER